MRAFRRLLITVIIIFILIAGGLDLYLWKTKLNDDGEYRVEAKRLADDMEENGNYDLSDYPHLTGVYTEEDGPLYTADEHYLIVEAADRLYRVEYTVEDNDRGFVMINIAMGVMFVVTIAYLLYIKHHIITPFGRISDVPQELAKGNLAVPLPEEKSRFFGKFTWGVNMLRENIEDSRQKEITMQKDRKLLLLSLSHDIKTPLSAIKLNAEALSKGLYKDEEKKQSVARSINKRADEIENFINEITKAASQDFMTFEVKGSEEFLSRIINKIRDRYAPQLALTGTEFKIEQYNDCLLSCDPDRLAECIQNLIENAIKYGDGRIIGIRFSLVDGYELITVYNSGCTLAKKDLPEIFESFHRGANATGIKGNGLGLFICKKLMTLMNGDIYADITDGNFEVTLVVRLA